MQSILSVVISLSVYTNAQTCSETNQFCDCCCYTSISPELILLSADLNLYACTHVNYGLLPCCNPNSSDEPPLPPAIASFSPTHAPSMEPTQSPAEPQDRDGGDGSNAGGSGANKMQDGNGGGGEGGYGGGTPYWQVGMGGRHKPKKGPMGGMGPGPMGMKGKGKKGHKVGYVVNEQSFFVANADSGYTSPSVGFFAVGVVGMVAAVALVVRRRSKRIEEDKAPLLSNKRTYTGIFGDLASDPTAGSVLLADTSEPKITISPPRTDAESKRKGKAYGNFLTTIRGSSNKSPTNPQVEGSADERVRLVPLNSHSADKSTMETLKALGLVPGPSSPSHRHSRSASSR